ncbi:hypothetical protein Tco_1038732 [Tanacetum coccineum]
MIDDEEARENFMKDICTFLRKFSRISFGVMPKVLSIAWERFGEIKDALTDKQYRQEDIQELTSKLLEDYTIIYSKPKAITPDLPDNSLSMGDEHLDTIPSIENLVPIPSEFECISEDTCDVPVCKDPSTFDVLSDHSEILSDSNNDGTSSDDGDFENTEYVEASPLNLEYDSLEEVNEDQKEKEFDLEDIFQIQDIILREKLLNISRLVTNIESLKNNLTLDFVFKSPSSFSYSTIIRRDEKRQFHSLANPLFRGIIRFFFRVKPIREGLISIVILIIQITLFGDSEFESFHFDLEPAFPRPPPEPPDVEISLIIETDAPVINNFDELNEDECFDPGGDEINAEDDDSFIFIIRTFSRFSLTLWILLYFSPPGVKTRFMTPTSPLRAGGFSSGWNFHVL